MSRYPNGTIEYMTFFSGFILTLSGATYFNKMPFYAIVLFALGIFCNIALKPNQPGVKKTIYWIYIVLLYLFCIFAIFIPTN